MKIKCISRDWKGAYGRYDVEQVRGMFLHGSEKELDEGNGYYMMFVSEPTDICPKKLFKIYSDILWGEEEVEGYQFIDSDTIERK